MRLSLWFICAAIAFALTGCDDSSVNRALEVRCVPNTGFDSDMLCSKPDRPGAEVAVRVNATAQTVQITIVKNDGTWGTKDYILDHCSVVDTWNWKCTETTGKPGGPFYMVREYGMLHDRYYTSLTGGGTTDYYRSSISGLTFWAFHYGIIDMKTALTKTGYSAQALSTFGKEE
jgi:hypothetical protein